MCIRDSRSIARLHQGEVRTLDEDVPAEIRPLVREINHLMELTRQRLQRSRTATGNLAHALKTPLSALARLRDDPAMERAPQVRSQVERHVDAMARLIDKELKRARLAGGALPGARFAPAQELPDLVDALRRLYDGRGLVIETELAGAGEFPGDREDMLELFGNLLDNACKWARSRVRLRVLDTPGLAFTVEDDGPGVADQALAGLTERGRRLDESAEGHGLGLSIVRRIIEKLGGAVGVQSQAGQGCTFWFTLPAA